MLESRRLLVRARIKFFKTHYACDIFDPDGDPRRPVGFAENVAGPVARLLRRTRIEVRELPDESLVFTVSRGSFFRRSRVEVHDALGVLVGWFGHGGHIRTGDGRPFADLAGGTLRTPAGVELAQVSRGRDGHRIEMAEELDGQPLAKMLVVAAALTLGEQWIS